MPRRSLLFLLGGLLALSSLSPTNAGPNANSFSDSAARPMMKNMGGDLNVGNVIALANNPDPNQAYQDDCSVGGGICQYITFIVTNVVVGLLILPLTIFFFNFVFCCGRCCCVKRGRNKQGCTGGRYPTREYNKLEGVFCIVLLAIFMLILFAFSVAGAASFDESKADLDDMLDGIGELGETPADFKNKIVENMAVLKVDIRASLQPLNVVFDDVATVKSSVASMRTKFTTLETALKSLAALIEGCSFTDASCTSSTRVANWNQCTAGSSYSTHSTTGTGKGALLTNADTSPTCKDATSGVATTCKCAPTVHGILTAVTTSIAAIPSDSDLDGLDVPLPLDELDDTIDKAAADFSKPLDDFQNTVVLTTKETDVLKGQLNGGIISLITFLGYSPAWYVIIMIIVALVLGAPAPPFRDNAKFNSCSQTCWWVAYVMLTLWLMLFVWPLYGGMTIPAVLLEDICDVLPVPGGNAAELMNILQSAETDQDTQNLVSGLIEGCLLPLPPNKGYLWTAIPGNITRQFMRDQVSQFNTGNSINTSDIVKNLRVLEYTKSYKDITPTIAALSATDYSTFGFTFSPTYSNAATEQTYFQTNDLATAVTAVKSASADVDSQITTTNTASAALETSLGSVITTTSNVTETLVDSLWELGTCEILAEKYQGLYDPFCNIAHIVGASWGALLLSGCFGMLILPCICGVSKRMYQYQHPFSQQQDKLAQEGGIIVPAPMGQPVAAAQGHAVGQPMADTVAVPMAVAVAVPAEEASAPLAPPPDGIYPKIEGDKAEGGQ